MPPVLDRNCPRQRDLKPRMPMGISEKLHKSWSRLSISTSHKTEGWGKSHIRFLLGAKFSWDLGKIIFQTARGLLANLQRV